MTLAFHFLLNQDEVFSLCNFPDGRSFYFDCISHKHLFFQLSTTLEAVNDEHDQLDFEAEEPDKVE